MLTLSFSTMDRRQPRPGLWYIEVAGDPSSCSTEEEEEEVVVEV